jgi:hypothetical protein
MTKTPISLQDLRRSLYVKAKAESAWRFWGLYVHVCKTETLQQAYLMAKSNDGAPGIDGAYLFLSKEAGLGRSSPAISPTTPCRVTSARSWRSTVTSPAYGGARFGGAVRRTV